MSGKKSFISKIEESILRSLKPDYMDSKEKLNELLNERQKNPEKVPNAIFKSTCLNGIQVFEFGDKSARNMILFIHGGAFIGEINYQHLIYCLLMSKRLDAHVIAPVYPLVPNSHEKAFEMIADLYKFLIEDNNFNGYLDNNNDNENSGFNVSSDDNSKNNNRIALMGDSAGGGFVFSFCQHLKTLDLPQPDNIVTFSPWVDVSMSNSPYDNESDPILGEIGLREIGKIWAGDVGNQDYRVSPLFGDNSRLPKTLIFVGDNEIFYKDVLKYCENLKGDGVDVRLIVGSGMFHIYPMFPSSEAWDAFKELKKEFK